MDVLPLFVDSKYEVRSGWKFLAYSTLLVVLFVATGTGIGTLVVWLDPAWLLMSRTDIRFVGLNALVLSVPALGSLLIMSRFVDRVPISVFGVTLHEGWFRDLCGGLALAGGMIGLTLAGSFLFGRVQLRPAVSVEMIPAIVTTIAVLLLAAFNEELVFRGYPLQIFLKPIGPLGAMLLISSI